MATIVIQRRFVSPLYQEYNKKVYDLNAEGHDISNFEAAMKKADEWEKKIPIGIFYEKQAQVFESHFP